MAGQSDRREFLKLTGAGAAALTLSGSGLASWPARAQDMRTLTVAWDTDIDSLDPAVFKSIGAYITQCNIYDSPLFWRVRPVEGKPGLARSFPGELEGGVAESWAFENDGATLVLKVRRGLKFPSGRPVTAHSVKYLFDRGLQSPGYMRIVLPVLLRVKSPDDFEVRDEFTLAIKMPSPTPMALDVMALSNNALLDPDEVKAHATKEDPWATEWLKRNVAGLGPYRVAKNEPGVEVVLEANPTYWRPQPFYQRIALKFVPNESDRILLLKRKAVDTVIGRPGLSPKSINSLEGEKGLKIYTVADTTCHWLCMNQTKKPLDNVKVRQAINYAIPIQAILPNVLYGYGSQMKSPVPNLTPGYDGAISPYKHDLAKAKALMAEAGLANQTIPMDLAIRAGWLPHEQAATWIQRELEKIGFKINIVRETDATFRQVASKGDHQLSIESFQSWINDPFYHMFFNFHSKAKGTNTAFYSNPAIDKIIDENMHEVDAKKRLAAAKEAQKIVIGEAVWGFLWYDNWTRVARADLSGFEKRWDTFDRFRSLKLG
jgi:peptide/nickel transport system substrate-binding protein